MVYHNRKTFDINLSAAHFDKNPVDSGTKIKGCDVIYGAFRVESCFVLCSRGFFLFCFVFIFCSVMFSIVIPWPGKERAGLCASRSFVCLFCTR